jgi:hypothetical protein
VRRLAVQTKDDFGTLRRRPVNVVRCLESGEIRTYRGRQKLIYRALGDGEMGAADAKTEFTHNSVIVSVKQSVQQDAIWGDGRSRMTLAHELGHGVLHWGDPLYRSSAAAGATSISKLRPEDSAEHQAKVFASAFLIDDAVVEELRSPEEVSLEFLVSYEAAKLCFERVHREKHRREEGAERVRKANEAFQASMQKNSIFQFSYADQPCPSCKKETLIPMGMKFLCHTCGHISDAI